MLKSRLEIAQFKVGRSWQNLPFKSVEPQLEREAKLRNPDAYVLGEASQTAPTSPSRDAAFVVPDLPIRGRHHDNPIRQPTPVNASMHGGTEQTRSRVSPLKRQRSVSSERDTFEIASSPIKHRPSTSSFREHTSLNGGHITPPPSTPPPFHLYNARRRSGREDTEEGADLLLYLATSPSPAKSRKLNRGGFEFSSPPPIRGSSAVNTPVGAGFNLSEFLNFTP